jgi:hypothetical protein
MAFLSSTLHSLGIFEKISRIKEVLKNRLLDLTKRRDQAREQQRKRPHTSEQPSDASLVPASPRLLFPLSSAMGPSTSHPLSVQPSSLLLHSGLTPRHPSF